MTCRRCLADPHPENSEPRRCAFADDGTVALVGEAPGPGNWRCATMGVLRSVRFDDRVSANDHTVVVVACPHVDGATSADETHTVSHILLTHYKDRGRVDAIVGVDLDGSFVRVDLAICEAFADGIEQSRTPGDDAPVDAAARLARAIVRVVEDGKDVGAALDSCTAVLDDVGIVANLGLKDPT